MKTPFIFILLAVILTSFQIEEAELGLKLEKGKEYRQTSHTNSTVIQTFGDQDRKMEMVVKGSIVFLVKSTGNDQYELEARYEKVGYVDADAPGIHGILFRREQYAKRLFPDNVGHNRQAI